MQLSSSPSFLPDKSKNSGVVPAKKPRLVSIGSISSTGSDSEGQGSERPLLKNSASEEKKLFRKKKVGSECIWWYIFGLCKIMLQSVCKESAFT